MIGVWLIKDRTLADTRGEARALRDVWVTSILSQALCCQPGALKIHRIGNEKPSLLLEGEPAGDVSVSHSGDLLALTFSDHIRLGIDVEKLREIRSPERLASRYFSEAELAEFVALPESERRAFALQAWTRHEAVFKALGLGVRGMGDRLDLNRARGPTDHWTARWKGRSFQVVSGLECPEGFVLSLAYESEEVLPVDVKIVSSSF